MKAGDRHRRILAIQQTTECYARGCEAQPGQFCRSKTGQVMRNHVHASRERQYDRQHRGRL